MAEHKIISRPRGTIWPAPEKPSTKPTRRHAKVMRLQNLFFASLALALTAFAVPLAFQIGTIGVSWTPAQGTATEISLWCAAVLGAGWLVLQVLAIARFGWRGLLLLIGAPFAVWWPLFAVLVSRTHCTQNCL